MASRARWLIWPTIVAAILAAAAVVAMNLTAREAQSQDSTRNRAAEKPVSSADGPVEQSASEIRSYWTEERMENAKPADITIPGSPDESASPPAPQAPAVKIPPTGASGGATPEASSAEVQPMATTADGYTYPFPFSRYEVFASYTAPQYKTNGKVFFTKPGIGDFVCSGTVVNSENKSVVWTAGHCVNAGAGGPYHTNWQFVPAYKDGNAPLGRWTARELWTLNGWSVNGSFRYDLGAAVINLDASARRIANVVGAKGITFNVSSVQAWHDFGYPQASPFNGNRMNVCAASYAESDNPDTVSGDATIGIGCDMTGGSSGGGWVLGFGKAGGSVNSVNSYKYNAEPLSMYGPYHGTGAQNLYNSVRNR